MDDADTKAFEAWCEKEYGFTAGLMQDEARNGWQAACEWRDSQVGEPLYLTAQRTPFFAELWQSVGNDAEVVAHVYGKNQNEIDKRVKILNHLTFTAQINQQLVNFIQEWLDRQGSDNNYMTEKAKAALAVAKEQR